VTLHAVAAGWLDGLGHSGASRRLHGLLRALAPQLRAGERVTLLCGAAPHPALPARIELRTAALPAAPTWRRALAERRRLPALLRELRADLLDQSFLPLAPGLPCPAVVTVHDVRDLGPFRRRPRWLALRVLRASLARAARVVVPSRATAQALRAALGGAAPECAIVPGGVAPEFFAAPAPRGTPPFVLHVGHLEARKNLGLLLDAFAALPPPGEARLVFAGRDAGALARLRAQARARGIAARTEFPGIVAESALPALYAAAAAVAVPSLEEGFGLPVLEALAAGRPTLVSDAGALSELAGDAAQVLPARDRPAWTRALSAALADHDATAAEQRRARARLFSWERAAAALLDTWRDLA
jgi:glycosyltransferase involved in cell wall biosynthesis